MPELDVLIRGAGPVGCVLAAALRDSGLRVDLLYKAPAPAAFRPVVLSHASRLILERVGAWGFAPATPIESIEVTQAGGFGRTKFDARDGGIPALGYVTEYAVLASALLAQVQSFVVQEEAPARCVVHAEGAAADAEEKRYDQDAIVALVDFAPPSARIAYERFTAQGPLALLPFEGRYAVVWSMRPERAQALTHAPDHEFLDALANAAAPKRGRPLSVASRTAQPLRLQVRPSRIGSREVWIGNAAQSLHPVAGQGLNLGLRDAWELAMHFREAHDPGAASVLERYAATRRLDARMTILVTDVLARAFLGSGRLARAARGAALSALDLAPWPRRFFARRMIFGRQALP